MRPLYLLLLLLGYSYAACPSGSVYDQTFNRCYKYVSQAKAFASAEQDCASIGGNLVSIQNGFENGLIASTASSYFGSNNFWIGAQWSGSSWTWTDGSLFSYSNWAPGQPDKSQTCVAVQAQSYQWATNTCSSAKPYVCVVPQAIPTTLAPCTTRPTVIAGSVCPDGWYQNSVTKSCYKAFFNKHFEDAEKQCESVGAQLASIHNSQENSFVMSISTTGLKLAAEEMTWIGLRKVKHEWKWSDGSTADFLNWAPGEPASLSVDGCVQLVSDEEKLHAKAFGMWRNVRCGELQRAFVCKKPIQL